MDEGEKSQPMVVARFSGDEGFDKVSKRLAQGKERSCLTELLMKHGLIRHIPNVPVDESGDKAFDDDRRFQVLNNISGYLTEMNAKTAVIETEYVDRDYLDDFVRFYARCYENYPRKCHRVHFFTEDWEEKNIDDLLLQPNHEEVNDERRLNPELDQLQTAYLGYLIIRPLPRAIVGRTCLKVYPEEKGRHYKAVYEEKVSFFGHELQVKCEPFIQQDATTAVCASCALWSAFMVTAHLFQHNRYCPGCITELATKHGLYKGQRTFPNAGLFVRDMAYAIRSVGLDPIILQCGDNDNTNELSNQLGSIYACLNAGLPIILTGALYHKNDDRAGEHAVVINGYHISEQLTTNKKNGTPFNSDRIDKIYVHDDGVGPGARMTNPKWVANKKDGKEYVRWTTDWRDWKDPQANMEMEVHTLVIPAYKKIRVGYEIIVEQVNNLHKIIEQTDDLLKDVMNRLGYKRDLVYTNENSEWDIRLLAAKDLKREIRQDTTIEPNQKLGILKKGYPRFVWDVDLGLDGRREVRFLIDATDSEKDLCVMDVLFYGMKLAKILNVFSRWESMRQYVSDEDLKTFNPLLLKLRKQYKLTKHSGVSA